MVIENKNINQLSFKEWEKNQIKSRLQAKEQAKLKKQVF